MRRVLRKQTQPEDRPIRVCFVIDNLSRAGTEMQLLLLLKHLDRTQVQPYLCLLDGQDDSSRVLEPANVPIIRLGLQRLASLAAARQAVRLWRFLRSQRINVVQTFFPDSTRFAAPVAKAARIRAVVGSRRNIGHSVRKIDRLVARICNELFIDKIIANCEATRQSVIEQEKANPADVTILRNGLELDRFQNISIWKPRPEGPPYKIGMVGNVRHVKGPDVFIRAARSVLLQYPTTIFEIVGDGDATKYTELIRELRIADNVRFRGPLNNIPAFLETLDVAVLPSRAEGLSNALLEYMAAGRPIVATDLGGNPELIRNRIDGLTVPPENEHAIADAILELLRCPRLAEAYAASAAARSLRMKADHMADRYVEIVRDLLL